MAGTAVVLGAGMQGTCAALALAEAGWTVQIVDRAPEPLLGASRHGEGKIHLGLVYANEPSRVTAALMLDGALSFGPLVDRWLPEPLDWATLTSRPFHYMVLEDTMVAPDDLRAHYAWVDDHAQTRFANGESYLGTRPVQLVQEVAITDVPEVADGPLAAFATAETAVEMRLLREPLIAALEKAGVAFTPLRTVCSVERRPEGFAVELSDEDGARHEMRADIVVNCLWDGRLRIDQTMDIQPGRPWVFRLKQSIEGRSPGGPGALHSLTLALGPFGDVVVRSDGRIYASWYPTCLAGWSDAIAPPDDWRTKMDGTASPAEVDRQVRQILDDFGAIVPPVRELTDVALHAGVIAAWGATDIDDAGSELHSRFAVGVHAHDGYLSIDTGKLTTAPLFAQRLMDHL